MIFRDAEAMVEHFQIIKLFCLFVLKTLETIQFRPWLGHFWHNFQGPWRREISVEVKTLATHMLK